jgi:hypothetical protein
MCCRWTIHPLNEQLKAKARAAGLWNLWMAAGGLMRLLFLVVWFVGEHGWVEQGKGQTTAGLCVVVEVAELVHW